MHDTLEQNGLSIFNLRNSPIRNTASVDYLTDEASNEEMSLWAQAYNVFIQSCRENAAEFKDEGISLPSSRTLLAGEEIAEHFGKNGFGQPTRIVPNGEGGLVFEQHNKTDMGIIVYSKIELFEDLSAEFSHFENGSLIRKEPIDVRSFLRSCWKQL